MLHRQQELMTLGQSPLHLQDVIHSMQQLVVGWDFYLKELTLSMERTLNVPSVCPVCTRSGGTGFVQVYVPFLLFLPES